MRIEHEAVHRNAIAQTEPAISSAGGSVVFTGRMKMRKTKALLASLLGGFLLLACGLLQEGEVRGLGEARSVPKATATLEATASPTPTEIGATPTSTDTIRSSLKLAPPTATPTSTTVPESESESEPAPETASVRVAPDGSGDYASLEEAVGSVPEGTSIVLDPGTFRLAGPLEIAGSFSLQGAGMDQTEVICDSAGHVVRFNGAGAFSAEGIAFRHEGATAADVVVVDGGEAVFDGCRFTGAISGGDIRMAGLRVQGSATGEVRDCAVEANDAYGILLTDQAQMAVEGNSFTENERVGLVYEGSAGGTASGNDSSLNKGHGIVVAHQAQPTLEDNRCAGNERSGIAYFDEAGGAARNNNCTMNWETGIFVGGQSQPTVEGNACANNIEAGIWYAGTAEGVARGNESSGHVFSGIVVGEQAQPTLEGNTCSGNTEAGIWYADNAGGAARGNECSGNKFGIAVNEPANPELVDNHLHDNSAADIQDWR
jgi:parallel beta-helix repeat protein